LNFGLISTGMNRIRLLPEQVANQIAAGEVIERPASVVKELVENALDAGATRVTVEIQAGGRSLIRVTDDGWGMNRDDALLSLERHATSKIQKAEDLSAIATMGFRGEAIPSIASVSRMTITTREHDAEAATQILINGGKIVEVKAAGSPPGTAVEVRQIFFNLPARRKFLRSEETEYAHIHHYLTLAALAHPHVAFTLLKDGRTIWQLAPTGRGGAPRRPGESSAASSLSPIGGEGEGEGASAVARNHLEGLRERMRALMGAELELLPVDHSAVLANDADKADVSLSPTGGEGQGEGAHTSVADSKMPTQGPLELTIAPGQTIPAWLGIKRNGHEDLVTFTVENLPHGIIVDNIGLNGVLIPKGQNEREIFLTAAKWVPETDRLCYAIENQAGNQTSRPLLLHVRKPGAKIASK
jgi:hypothetical protein